MMLLSRGTRSMAKIAVIRHRDFAHFSYNLHLNPKFTQIPSFMASATFSANMRATL
jgi:hypothetical protein